MPAAQAGYARHAARDAGSRAGASRDRGRARLSEPRRSLEERPPVSHRRGTPAGAGPGHAGRGRRGDPAAPRRRRVPGTATRRRRGVVARRRHVDGQQRRRVDGRRGPALHPLHVREHGRAQGHRPRDGRLHGRRGPLVPDGLRRADARGRRLVLHGRLRLDHGPHLRRLRPPAERRDADRLRGRAVVARRGPPLAHRRPAQGHAPLHGADGDPRAHALRRRPRRGHVARVAQAAGLRRRADQPRGPLAASPSFFARPRVARR